MPDSPVVSLDSVTFVRDGRMILSPLTWQVLPGERWLVLGANGSGKTTMLRIASMHEHPSSGVVRVLGEQLGRTDVRVLRRRIGYLSASLAGQLRPNLAARDVVMTARYAALEPWWHRYTQADADRAAERELGTLSSGEQQRVLLARTLMNEPGVVMLDEPSARLDLGGREELVRALAELTTDPIAPPLVLVTHHLDEVPPGMTHVMLLRDGIVTASGPLEDTLRADALSECFGLPLVLERRDDGRFSAWAAPAPTAVIGRTGSAP